MAESKKASGPWTVHRSQFNPPQIQAADGRLVTDRVFNGFEDLAGAAPDLLDTCETLLDRLERYMPADDLKTIADDLAAARKTIAKARGEVQP